MISIYLHNRCDQSCDLVTQTLQVNYYYYHCHYHYYYFQIMIITIIIIIIINSVNKVMFSPLTACLLAWLRKTFSKRLSWSLLGLWRTVRPMGRSLKFLGLIRLKMAEWQPFFDFRYNILTWISLKASKKSRILDRIMEGVWHTRPRLRHTRSERQ